MTEMRVLRFYRVLCCIVVASVVAGCSFHFSTAHLTNLTLSKTRNASVTSTTFERHDTIYGHAAVANSISKVTLKWHVVAQRVAGAMAWDPPNNT
jgi:hypothetical protein